MLKRPHLLPCLISASMLFAAIAPLPYGYYQILRWVVFATAMYLVYLTADYDKSQFSWVFIGLAILFNPLFPVTLSKETWLPIDIISGVVILSTLLIKNPKYKEASGRPKLSSSTNMNTGKEVKNESLNLSPAKVEPAKPHRVGFFLLLIFLVGISCATGFVMGMYFGN